jgi:hypothetical protein
VLHRQNNSSVDIAEVSVILFSAFEGLDTLSMDDIDIYKEALSLFDKGYEQDEGIVQYGDLVLSVAPKVRERHINTAHLLIPWLFFRKARFGIQLTREFLANTVLQACSLLADQLFSPSLALAEMIELGKINSANRTCE